MSNSVVVGVDLFEDVHGCLRGGTWRRIMVEGI